MSEPERENDIWVPLDDGRLCLIAGPLFRTIFQIFEKGKLEIKYSVSMGQLQYAKESPKVEGATQETFQAIKYIEHESGAARYGFVKVTQ